MKKYQRGHIDAKETHEDMLNIISLQATSSKPTQMAKIIVTLPNAGKNSKKIDWQTLLIRMKGVAESGLGYKGAAREIFVIRKTYCI